MTPERSGPRESNESWVGSTNYQAGSDQEQDARFGGGSDVVLDVPVLQIDEIDLEVDDLRVHVSLRAELADLVKVNAGIDAYLDKVKLSVKGVEAQATLRIGLQRVLDTLDRALETIDRNPQILGGTVRQHRDESGNVTENTWNGSNGVEYEEATGSLADLQIEEEYVDERGWIVALARDETGNVVEEVLDEDGGVRTPDVSEGVQDREPEGGENGEVDATDAARRKAEELGVKLSGVRGTGSGGRVLLKDVKRASKRSAGPA